MKNMHDIAIIAVYHIKHHTGIEIITKGLMSRHPNDHYMLLSLTEM